LTGFGTLAHPPLVSRKSPARTATVRFDKVLRIIGSFLVNGGRIAFSHDETMNDVNPDSSVLPHFRPWP
jgi:hypothetical protein